MPAIPKGWKDYVALGEPIDGTPFVAFKTPLKLSLCSSLQRREEYFTLNDLMERQPRLGLIIDLTFTNRYYNAEDLRLWNVEYKKIYCTGHGVVPSRNEQKAFAKAVDDFLALFPDKLIGVHCTHGVNRTGFMVCKYMVSKLSFKPETAIECFEKARGHKIVRLNYVDALLGKEQNIYQDSRSHQKNESLKPKSNESWRHAMNTPTNYNWVTDPSVYQNFHLFYSNRQPSYHNGYFNQSEPEGRVQQQQSGNSYRAFGHRSAGRYRSQNHYSGKRRGN